jgi:DNA-3-methyladenine glycosylase I
VPTKSSIIHRCPWGPDPEKDALYCEYHDTEWGVPERDGQALFAKLILDGAQAGLSWRTILYKRDRYYEVFQGFDPQALAKWTAKEVESALLDPGIVRNRLKVNAVVKNSKAIMTHFDGDLKAFSTYLWDFVGGKPLQATPAPRELGDFAARTEQSDAMSKALQKLGFTFVGSTICYAFMQAVGLVNDHSADCFRRKEVAKLK